MLEDEDTLTSPLLPGLALIISTLLLLVSLRGWTAPVVEPIALLPVGAYLLAELVAPPLSGVGRFPLSAAALVVSTSLHPAISLFCLLVGSCIRWLRLRNQGVTWIAELVPEMLCVAIARFSPAEIRTSLAAFTYVLVWLPLPGIYDQVYPPQLQIRWGLSRERSLAALVFLLIMGVAVSLSQSVLVGALMLYATPLLSIPMRAQTRVLDAEVKEREHRRTERAQTRRSRQIDALQGQVELQKVEVEVQKRVLGLVGELFMETSGIEDPAALRPALLNFLRKTLPCGRISLYEMQGGQLRQSCALGVPGLDLGNPNGVRPGLHQTNNAQHLIAHIPERGLLVLSEAQPGWTQSDFQLLNRLANQLPLCLDAVRYRELQSRLLGEEQTRRKELDRLAARLTVSLDLLGQLVALRSVAELIDTARASLPRLLPGYQAEIDWQGLHYGAGPTALTAADYTFPLTGNHTAGGSLGLRAHPSATPLDNVENELLRLFSSQLSSLLEGAELYHQLHSALERLKQSQAQLVQSSKMAAIGQLAAGVAHELNTPLGAISIAVELAVENMAKSPERAEKRLRKALDSVEQMQQIIAKLLFYSRDSRGMRGQVELGKVMTDSFNLVAHTLKLHGVQVEVAPGPEVVVEANANELQQVFSNLLINAKDACNAPGATKKRIEMWLETQNNQAHVHVRDYGCGMDDETRQRIFDPFFTTKAVGEGTGLGLSTSLELIEQHQGTLNCQSLPGQGTHFIVSLPL